MSANKVTTPEEAVAGIPDGATIALGGVHSHNSPMALVNALIRRGVRDLELIPTPSAGAPVDMLIAAGCVKRLHVSYVGLEFLGMAPNYRRAAESQSIEIVEGTRRTSSTASGPARARCRSCRFPRCTRAPTCPRSTRPSRRRPIRTPGVP
jgi:acyl CoA:acetate/3-ketoacid CoA transferase alpha subunit